MKDYLKEKWKTLLIILGVALCGFLFYVPRLINNAYIRGNELGKAPNTMFSASDWLGFYGSFLAFVGTIILGVISLIQNSRLHKTNLQIEEENKRIQLLMAQDVIPVIVLEDFISSLSCDNSEMYQYRKFNHIDSTISSFYKIYELNIYNHQLTDSPYYSVNGVFTLINSSKVKISSVTFVSFRLDKRITDKEGKLVNSLLTDLQIFEENENTINSLYMPNDKINCKFRIVCDQDYFNIVNSSRLAIDIEIRMKLLTGLSFTEIISIEQYFNMTPLIAYMVNIDNHFEDK